MQLLKRLDHAAVTAAIAAVLYGLFMAQYLRAHDPAFLVQAGEYFVDTTQAPPNLFTVTASTGYDGTFFYRLALTPFTRERTAFGITLDTPRYRHQRILYPLLAWAFSFGSPPLALSALISVNYLALGGLGWLAGVAAKSAGRHALWGLALVLYPGFLITFSRDLAEIIEALFVLAVIVAWQRQRPGAAAAFLALAILAKETALLVAAAAGVTWAWQAWRGRERPRVRWVLIPMLVYAAWQLWLEFWWGASLAEPARANLGLPLVGIAEGFQSATAAVGGSPTRWLIEAGALALLALGTLAMLRRSTALPAAKVSWLLYLLLTLVLTAQVWIEDMAFLRAAALFYLFSLIILMHTRDALARGLQLLGIGAWAAMAVHYLYFR